MSAQLAWVTVAALLWLGALFLVAYAAERGRIPQSISQHPSVYALSLGVFATSWSYFGSVQYAQQHGMRYLAIYLGATLSCFAAPLVWRPVLRLTRELQLTSLADVFAYRYPGQLTGMVVTLFLWVGSLPYLALQIRAVSDTARVVSPGVPGWLAGLGYCAVLIVFSILFGARHVTPRERHEGLVLAIAFESLLKVAALLGVGLFALFWVLDGPAGLASWLRQHPGALERMTAGARDAEWAPLILISFAAAFLLPRQFHIAFTESPERDSLRAASWGFPLLLWVMNLAIPPILWAGTQVLPSESAALYTVLVPLEQGAFWLAVVAFLGGVSASSAMVIVTALALAPMGLTYLVLPLGFARARIDLYRRLLWARRALIAVVVAAGYVSFLALDPRSAGLVDLGLVSFVAVAQFLPGLLGVLVWPRATRAGFLWGLGVGILFWFVTLVMPLVYPASRGALVGPLARAMGFPLTEPWGVVTFVSLSLNALVYFAVSLWTRQSQEEQGAARVCTGRLPVGVPGVVAATSPEEFRARLAPLLGDVAAGVEVERAREELEVATDERRPSELRRLRDAIERNLSGLLGPVLARMVVDEALQVDPRAHTALADQIRFLEERLARGMAGDATVRELEEVRRYLRRTLEHLPLGVCALGPDEDVVIWNDALEAISKVPAWRAEGLHVSAVPPPWGELFGRVARTPQGAATEERVWVDGRERVLALHRTTVAESGQGGGRGAVLVVEDLTERKAVDARLAHQDRLASLGRIAAGVAHEIGNPLTGIASVAQNLKSDPEDLPERLDHILQQARRIDAIVRALVSFSHAGVAGGGQPAFTRVEVRPLVDEAISLARMARRRSAAECHNECPAGLAVLGDAQRLEQVVVNLLANALDATPAGRRVVVSAGSDGDQVRLQVRDEGEGIPAELQGRVFEPFFTTKPVGQGTGLGLALVNGIVQDHGGAVGLESRKGEGTTVTITLRKAPPAQESPA